MAFNVKYQLSYKFSLKPNSSNGFPHIFMLWIQLSETKMDGIASWSISEPSFRHLFHRSWLLKSMVCHLQLFRTSSFWFAINLRVWWILPKQRSCYFVLIILVLNSLLLPTTMFWCFDGSLHFLHQLAICFLAWIPHMSWFKRCQHHRFREKDGLCSLVGLLGLRHRLQGLRLLFGQLLAILLGPTGWWKEAKNVQNPHQNSRKDGFQLAMLHVFLLSKCTFSGKWVWKDAMNIELIIGVPTEIHWFGSPHWILGHVPHRKFETLIIVLQRGKVGRSSSPKTHCIRCPSKIIHWKKKTFKEKHV